MHNAVVSSLQSIAARGDLKVLAVAMKHLTASDCPDSACIELIGHVAPVGHEEAVALTITFLSAAESVGQRALQTLKHIAMRGDHKSLLSILRLIERAPSEHQQLQMQLLSAAVLTISDVGDEFAMGKVRCLLSHRSRDVRATAVKTLILLCRPDNGDESAIQSLRMCLQCDADEFVRLEALEALRMCVQPNDVQTLQALANCVTDTSILVQMRASLVLSLWALPHSDADAQAEDRPHVEAAVSAASESVLNEAKAKAAALAAKNQRSTHEYQADCDVNLQKIAIAERAAKKAADKAGLEAGQAASATAQKERAQYREVLLKSVTSTLVQYARCIDSNVCSAAMRTLRILCSSCSSVGIVSTAQLMQQVDATVDASRHTQLMEQDIHIHQDLFEGLLLLGGPNDIKQLISTFTARMTGLMQRCLQAFDDLAQDFHKRLGAAALSSSENSTDIFALDPKFPHDDQLRDIALRTLVPIITGDDRKTASMAREDKKGRQWMAVLALKRCALELLGRHSKTSKIDREHCAREREEEKANWTWENIEGHSVADAGEGATQSEALDKKRNASISYHVIFAGEVGERLKNSLIPALLNIIDIEEDPRIRHSVVAA